MAKNKFTLLFFLLTTILTKEAFCGCSPSQFYTFITCFVEYSHSEFAKKPFTQWADVEKTCKDFWQSQQCMGQSVINHCANTNGFTKYTQSQEDGAEMATNYWHLNFICGKGHEAGKKVFPCLLTKMKSCFISNCTCDVLQETINVCSQKTQESCGKDAYYYIYGTLATGRCHINPECEFLREYCEEISDYANAPSEIEKLHNDGVLRQKTHDPETALIARIISAEEVSPQELSTFIPKMIRILKQPSNEQFASAWILRSLTRLSPDFVNLVVEEDAVPILIKLLESTDIDLQEQVILGLGNIIGSSPDLRDYCIQQGIIEPLTKIISPNSKIKTVRHIAWVIMNILKHDDLSVSSNERKKLLVISSKLLEYDDVFILTDIFWGLGAFAFKSSTNIQILIDYGIVNSVIEYLSHDNPKIKAGALRTCLDSTFGTRDQVQYLVDNGILQLLKDHVKTNNKVAIFFLNTFISRHHEFIQNVYDAELVPALVSGLINDTIETQINSLVGIDSIVDYGNANHTIKLIHMNVVYNLCKFLAQLEKSEDVINIRLILMVINEIFKKDVNYHTHAVITKQIINSGGLAIFERLQKHDDKRIRLIATAFFKPIHDSLSADDAIRYTHDEF